MEQLKMTTDRPEMKQNNTKDRRDEKSGHRLTKNEKNKTKTDAKRYKTGSRVKQNDTTEPQKMLNGFGPLQNNQTEQHHDHKHVN